jgi:tRNA nucleotidyltransferase (CCA-adding enzyme)
MGHNKLEVIFMEKDEIFKEFEYHILNDSKPSIYFNEIFHEEWFKDTYPMKLLSVLAKVEQSPKHHPEGNVWRHTMLVLDYAATKKDQSGDARVFMWAALLHDLGKAETTRNRNGKITAYDHDKIGEKLARDFLKEFSNDIVFINSVSKLVRWHMQILFVVNKLPFADINQMLKDTSVEEVALLGLCDRLGRGKLDINKIEEEHQNINTFIDTCQNFKTERKYLN